MPRDRPAQRRRHIHQLRRAVALNYANANSLITWGASEEFVQPLRNQAAEWEAEADQLEAKLHASA